jgi:hypothetical protein
MVPGTLKLRVNRKPQKNGTDNKKLLVTTLRIRRTKEEHAH